MNQIAVQERNQAAVSPERRATPVEVFVGQVMGDEGRKEELFRALPSHIPPARFQRNLFNLLMQKPEILQYDPRYVYREVSKAAALGLSLDPQFAEADIVLVWNAKTSRKEPELRPRYKGLMKLARQSGEVADIYPGEVREADYWVEDQGTERRLEHRIDRTQPRGKPICYYAVVIYKDGTKDFEVMDMDEIHAVRERSEGWRAFQNGKIKSTPWATDEGEMCKKTVLKRLLKRVPQSSDLAEAISLDHDREPLATIDMARPAIRQAPEPQSIASRLDQFAEAEEIAEEPIEDQVAAPAASSPVGAQEPETERSGATSPVPADVSGPSAAPEAGSSLTEGAADVPLEPKIAAALEMGRGARRSGYKREIPKKLAYKSMVAEQEAFFRGWDEEDQEQQIAENGGTV